VLEVVDFCGGDHDISGVSFELHPELFARCRRLRVLEIYGGQLSLCKTDIPEGRELSVYSGGFTRADLKHIVARGRVSFRRGAGPPARRGSPRAGSAPGPRPG